MGLIHHVCEVAVMPKLLLRVNFDPLFATKCHNIFSLEPCVTFHGSFEDHIVNRNLLDYKAGDSVVKAACRFEAALGMMPGWSRECSGL